MCPYRIEMMKDTRMSKITVSAAVAALAISLSLNAAAGEVDTYCELSTARATVQAELLTSLEGFSSYGDPVTGARSATLGVRKSISRGLQGQLINQLGAAECEAYRAERNLAEQLASVESRAELKAIDAKKPLLLMALAKAEENVAIEQKMLKAQTGTLSDLRAAFDQRDRLRQELATLDSRYAQLKDQLPAAQESLESLLNSSFLAQGEVAELNAKINAQSGWDIQISAGTRADFRNGGKTEGFVALTATRSFGADSSSAAASRVGSLTSKLLREQRDGAFQQLLRTRDSVAGVVAAERMVTASLKERNAVMAESAARLEGVETTEGLRTKRALAVEIAKTDSDLAAADARIESLSAWAKLNAAQ